MIWRKKDPELELEVDPDPPLTVRERVAVVFLKLRFVLYLLLVLGLMAMAFLGPRMFITVPPGHHAVMYRFFGGGTDTQHVWGEGLHVIPPWDRLTTYDTRLQQRMVKFDVLSEEGLALGVQVSVRYRPALDMLGFIQRDVGKDYFEKLVLPEVKAHTRHTFGDRPAHEIYSSARDVLQELGRVPVLGRIDDAQGGRNAFPYVIVQELKLMDIALPPMVSGAIADKYRQEQLMLEYRYKLEREEKEAERKRTEAAGIRDYNEIMGRLSPEMLRLKSIEATLELSKSPGSRVVVLGGGQGQTPPLLMNLEGPAPAPHTASLSAPPPPATPGPKTAPQGKPPDATGARPSASQLETVITSPSSQPPAPSEAAPEPPATTRSLGSSQSPPASGP